MLDVYAGTEGAIGMNDVQKENGPARWHRHGMGMGILGMARRSSRKSVTRLGLTTQGRNEPSPEKKSGWWRHVMPAAAWRDTQGGCSRRILKSQADEYVSCE